MSRKDLVLSEIWGSEDIVGRPSSVLFLSQAVERGGGVVALDSLVDFEDVTFGANRARGRGPRGHDGERRLGRPVPRAQVRRRRGGDGLAL